jgi:hypothetical protein
MDIFVCGRLLHISNILYLLPPPPPQWGVLFNNLQNICMLLCSALLIRAMGVEKKVITHAMVHREDTTD